MGSAKRTGYLLLDQTGSLSNPSHNNTKIRYEATSNLPRVPPAQLRMASADYPDAITANLSADAAPRSAHPSNSPNKSRAGSTNEYDKAAKIERYLKTHYRYTLDLTGRVPPIRSLIFFSLAAPAIANISPRP